MRVRILALKSAELCIDDEILSSYRQPQVVANSRAQHDGAYEAVCCCTYQNEEFPCSPATVDSPAHLPHSLPSQPRHVYTIKAETVGSVGQTTADRP